MRNDAELEDLDDAGQADETDELATDFVEAAPPSPTAHSARGARLHVRAEAVEYHRSDLRSVPCRKLLRIRAGRPNPRRGRSPPFL